MAYRIKTLNGGEGNLPAPFIQELDVKSGTAGSIEPGMLVVKDGSNAGYVAAGANGATTSAIVVGVAASTSSETASADGKVLVESAPYFLAQMFATTPGNLSQAVKLTACTLDVSSGSYTVDENDTTNGFIRIYSYDSATGECIVSFACDVW